MISYKLSRDGQYAQKFEDGVPTGEWHNTQSNEQYLAWLAEGNAPLPADAPTE